MRKAAGLLGNLLSGAQKHLQLLTEAGKLTYQVKATELVARAADASVAFFFALTAWLFVNLGILFFLAEKTGSLSSACFIVGGFNVVCLFAGLALFRGKPGRSLKNKIISRIAGVPSDYAALAAREAALKNEIAVSQETLKNTYGELRAEVSKLTDFSNGEDDESDRNHAAADTVEFLLEKVVLAKAGPIKKLVVPVITKAVIGPLLKKFFNRNKKNGEGKHE